MSVLVCFRVPEKSDISSRMKALSEKTGTTYGYWLEKWLTAEETALSLDNTAKTIALLESISKKVDDLKELLSHDNGATIPDNTERTEKEVILEKVRSLRERGLSVTEVAKALKAAGVPTISGRGEWRSGTVTSLRKKYSIP